MKRSEWAYLAAALSLATGLHLYSQNAEAPKSKSEFAPARAKMLGAVQPSRGEAFEAAANPQGDYVYEVTSAHSLVDGVGMSLDKDNPVKGLTTAMVGRNVPEGTPRLNGLYWRLKGVKPGKYWVGLVFQTGADANGAEAALDPIGTFGLFLNGRQVQCSTLSDPVQAAGGVWFAEAQGMYGESLKEGDEIAAVANHKYALPRTMRMILHSREPLRGAHRFRVNPGPTVWNQDTSLGISADGEFVAAPGKPMYPCLALPWNRTGQWMDSPGDFLRGPDDKAIAKCHLANPLPVPVEVDYECVVTGYYLQQAGRDAARLTLAPHSYVTRDIAFETTDDDPAYSIHTTLKPVKRPDLRTHTGKLPVGADLGWPPYDELAFFPGLRQLLPWSDPFVFVDHRRVDFMRPVKALRQRLALWGSSWELAYTADINPPMPPPADLKFAPCSEPWALSQEDIPHSTCAYLRRKFTLPQGVAPGQVARLIVDSLVQEGTAYINGKRVGHVRGAWTPLIGEATAAIHPGENELVLVVRSVFAITNPLYVNPKEDPPVPSSHNTAHMDAPGDVDQKLAVGSDWGGGRGVWVEMSPDIASRDVKIDTSVRNQTIATEFAVVNGAKTQASVRVKVTVEDARKPILTVGERVLTLDPDQSQPLQFTKEWANPRLWNWKQPNLYVLTIELTDAGSGKVIDLSRHRFGFRESWIEDGQLMLNGLPVRLKGAGFWEIPSLQGNINAGIQVVRGSREGDYDDEIGMPSTDMITALKNTPDKYHVESDAFWDSCRANALVTMRRYWNHPSIIAWDLSNEWYDYAVYTGCDMKQAANRFHHLGGAVEKADLTRWTFFNGDFDIGGLHNVMSMHYMLDGAHSIVTGYMLDGHSAYLPDGAYYRPLDREFLPNEDLAVHAWQKDVRYRLGSKPIMDTEDLWGVGRNLPPATCKFTGEEAALGRSVGDSGPMIWRFKQDFDGQRDIGMAIHSNHDMPSGTVTRCHLLQTFFMPDVAHHGFAGRKVTRAYSLLNDIFQPVKLTFKWALAGPDGTAVQQGAESRDMETGQTRRGSISFTLPVVTKRTTYTLQLRLESDGVFVGGEDRDIEAWPDAAIPAGELSRKVFLYDPKGDTARAMKDAGMAFESAKALDAPAGEASGNVLVIGEGALDPSGAKRIATLGKFADDGGRVVVLAQTVLPQGLPAKTTLEKREWVSQPYVRLPIHPVLDGITSWDLHFWASDRVTARGSYSKPDGGAAIPLVDSGADTGLEWVQLMEMYRGKGLYLLCQLSLVEKYDQEPMARELLSRVLRYAGGKNAFRSPPGRLRLAAHRGDVVENRMKDLGIAYDLVATDADLGRNAPTMVEGGTVPAAATLAAWKASVSEGATLVVTGATAQDAAWLSDLAGTTVSVTVPEYRMWEGRGYRNGFDPLTAGLSHFDMAWKRYEELFPTTEDPTYVIEQFQSASVQADGGRELVFPGAMVEIKVGKGRLVLDERRWTTTNEKLATMADRNLSSLALGLNVNIAPVAPLGELPPDTSYRQIDLTPYATRSLADDVAEDGKGGWSDQGPDADLRDLPTGKQRFHDVPFAIGTGKKNIIVLASKSRPDKQDLPGEITVPIGCNVEGLYFIDAMAYSGDGSTALYQVQYADGTAANIPLICGKNIRDWATKDVGNFPHERGTMTVPAWTGKCKTFSPIAVYMTLWVNPRPDKVVTAVRFANPTREPVVALIGLTAVVKKGQEEASAELAKAQELFQQAQREIADSKNDQAKDMLRKAIAAAPDMTAAYQSLADLCEKTHREDEALEVYRQWTKAGARTPLPWNRLGEILEKHKDYKDALDAYTQSLKVEWNQPSAMEAKVRLEKLVHP